MLCGFDDDLAAQVTQTSNRIRGLLTQIHPALEGNRPPRLKVQWDEFGLRGLFPLDTEIKPDQAPMHQAHRIYESNVALIQACDVVMANLADFRGAGELDSGTAIEIGFAAAPGRRVLHLSLA